MPPENQTPDQQVAGWQFVPDQQTAPTPTPASPQADNQSTTDVYASWTASEFIAYQKNAGWYIMAFFAIIVVASITFFISKDWISAIAIVFIGLLFISFAARKPRVLSYEISSQGIKIGGKLYPYSSLKSFAVIEEEAIHLIDILPLQRFMPAVSIYYEPKDEQTIIGVLGTYLPQEERKQPAIDKLMHKIRF